MNPDNNGSTKGRKLVIIGGVAGGASCAARARRLDETAEILLLQVSQWVMRLVICLYVHFVISHVVCLMYPSLSVRS